MNEDAQELRNSIVARCVKRGDRVQHLEYGPATVTGIKAGIIKIKLDQGYEGTTTIMSLRRLSTI